MINGRQKEKLSEALIIMRRTTLGLMNVLGQDDLKSLRLDEQKAILINSMTNFIKAQELTAGQVLLALHDMGASPRGS